MLNLSAAARKLTDSVHRLLGDTEAPSTLYVAQAFAVDTGDMTFLGVFGCPNVARVCARRAVALNEELHGADVLVSKTAVIEQAWAYNPRTYVD